MALLSKSTFLKGVQCVKYIYLDKYFKKEKDPVTDEQQVKFDFGHKVGELAKNYFKGGLDISLISNSRAVLVQETKVHLAKDISIFYEATFEYNDVLVMADVIIKEDDGWVVYEIKSGQKLSDTNRIDASLQYYVINGSGLPIKKFYLACLNYPKQLVKEMSPIEIPSDLFLFEDVTELCQENHKHIDSKIKELKTTLALPSIPSQNTGDHCRSPYQCEFIGHCNNQNAPINEGLFHE